VAAQKFYVVWKGRQPGIYSSWDECKRQVDGFIGAQHKSFPTRAAAQAAYQGRATDHFGQAAASKPSAELLEKLGECYTVDAACSDNPGRLEYRCVHLPSLGEVFHSKSYPEGTNNIGEFLALVEALMLLKQKEIGDPVYSDSEIALSWLKAKECKTQLEESPRNRQLFELIQKAEDWLHAHPYLNKVRLWDTKVWGENPADFGRK
jgi:ribonuclease HI